jgi:hypothetical protein
MATPNNGTAIAAATPNFICTSCSNTRANMAVPPWSGELEVRCAKGDATGSAWIMPVRRWTGKMVMLYLVGSKLATN